MLHGISGPLTRDGRMYDESMPPSPLQNDYDIAAVTTYIRQAWGNDASAITPTEIKSVREKYIGRRETWTVEELNN